MCARLETELTSPCSGANVKLVFPLSGLGYLAWIKPKTSIIAINESGGSFSSSNLALPNSAVQIRFISTTPSSSHPQTACSDRISLARIYPIHLPSIQRAKTKVLMKLHKYSWGCSPPIVRKRAK
jgi:hypothetical protein